MSIFVVSSVSESTSLHFGFDDFNEGAYLTFKSIFHKALNLV